MKTKILIIFLTLIFSVPAFSQTNLFTKEEKEIIELIFEETKHYLDRDFEKWAECWLHEPFCRHYFMGHDLYNTYDGWNDMVEGFKLHFHGKKMENFEIQKCDFEIEIFDEVAFAHFTEKYVTTTEDEISIGTGKNNAVFIKHDGEWKFTTMNIAYVSSYGK